MVVIFQLSPTQSLLELEISEEGDESVSSLDEEASDEDDETVFSLDEEASEEDDSAELLETSLRLPSGKVTVSIPSDIQL